MSRLWKLVAPCMVALVAAELPALDCRLAKTPIEKAVCSEADVKRLDGELAELYANVRAAVANTARPKLLAQQRAWLAERDRLCASGDADCLRKQYEQRIDELHALNATARASNKPLIDVTPVIVRGKWKAASIKDPAPKGHAEEAVQQSLASAELTPLGMMAEASPGRFCNKPKACDDMGWTRRRLSQVDAAARISSDLSLKMTTPVLVGSSGATRSYYLLVPQSDGTVWAIFALCGPKGSDCWNAAEVWSPASPDAAVSPRP